MVRILTWRIRRIKHININCDIDSRTGGSFFESINDPLSTDLVNRSGGDEFKSASLVVFQVVLPGDWRADTRMN